MQNNKSLKKTKLTLVLRMTKTDKITYLPVQNVLRHWGQSEGPETATTETDADSKGPPAGEVGGRDHYTGDVHQPEPEASDHAVAPDEDAKGGREAAGEEAQGGQHSSRHTHGAAAVRGDQRAHQWPGQTVHSYLDTRSQ